MNRWAGGGWGDHRGAGGGEESTRSAPASRSTSRPPSPTPAGGGPAPSPPSAGPPSKAAGSSASNCPSKSSISPHAAGCVATRHLPHRSRAPCAQSPGMRPSARRRSAAPSRARSTGKPAGSFWSYTCPRAHAPQHLTSALKEASRDSVSETEGGGAAQRPWFALIPDEDSKYKEGRAGGSGADSDGRMDGQADGGGGERARHGEREQWCDLGTRAKQ